MHPTVLDPCCGSRMMWFDKAEAIKQNTIPSREGEGKPIMNHRNANVKASVKSLAKTKPI